MPEPIIRVENLGKKYLIRHKEAGPKYNALRDVLANGVKTGFGLFNRQGRGGSSTEEFWALKDVSFDVQPGEVVGIIGRNGAGKSTLLKILSRITEPTAGRVTLNGRVASLLEVGTGFHPELSGRENIFLNGTILGMKRAEIARKFDEIVAFAEVDKFLDTPVKRYSSGMYVRLAFAVAAHLEPEILVVDEVLAVGDQQFQQKCLGKMGEVARGGRTVLFVSHNMSSLNRLCSRGVLLEGGKVIFDGPTGEATAKYLGESGERGSGQKWSVDQAPGSAEVKLLSVRLEKPDGTPALTVSVAEPLRLVLRYRTLVPGLRFRCGANLKTEGTVAFSSQEPTETVRPVAGEYESAVEIPPHLLAEHEYAVAVAIFTNRGGLKERHLALPDVLTFQIYDPIDGTSARGDYAQNLAGVVRPKLPWTTTPTDC